MNSHVDKTQENKSQSVANEVSQKQGGGESLFQFVDNRPEAISQRKLQVIAYNRPQVSQLRALQEIANNSPQAKQAAQLQTMADNYSAQQQQSPEVSGQAIQKKAVAATPAAEVPLSETVGKNNTGLPDNLKTGMENLSGMSLDDVKVYRNSDKPAQLQAHAYAKGADIHLGPGQEKHLPHEAWHVVQQKEGRVKPTLQMKGGVGINDDSGLEREADMMGEKALSFSSRGQSANPNEPRQLKSNSISSEKNSSGIVQRRQLTYKEHKQLAQDKLRAKQIEEEYLGVKEQVMAMEGRIVCSDYALKGVQNKVRDFVSHYDDYVSSLREKSKVAQSSDTFFNDFHKKINWYYHGGGKNKLLNMERYLKKVKLDNPETVEMPSVMRFSDYLVLVAKLKKQTSIHNKKIYKMPQIEEFALEMEEYMEKVVEHEGEDWDTMNGLHQKIVKRLGDYANWESGVKTQFIELVLVASKKKVKGELLQEPGLMNVASRSDKREGHYMRSQNVHKMHIGGDNVNPFRERTAKFLTEGAKDYNIGGSQLVADTVMVQHELRRGRKKTSSEEFQGLRDDVIEHKNAFVTFIVNHFGDYNHLKAPVAQLDAKYPCVLILFEEDLMRTVNQSQDNIPEFITHLIAGHINAALTRAGVRPLLERRQSFGFMTPTITDVHSGVRLSLGITPSEAWCNAVIQGVTNADANIESYSGYKSVPGTTDITNETDVVMNKFNQGNVLGAGHKLITAILLSQYNKNSITTDELNQNFGTRPGEEVLEDIPTEKPDFVRQDVDEDAVKLLNRLKSFYEEYIKINDGEVEEEEVDWETIDPAEKIQDLLDEGLDATYADAENVMGLDESSDEDEVEPNRVPSGMSSLFLPIASYSETHTDWSIIYDTAPFSYFEIDGSWNRTFELDYIERMGVRYPLVTPAFKEETLKRFENGTKQDIFTRRAPFEDEISRIRKKGDEDVDGLRSVYSLEKRRLTDLKEKTKEEQIALVEQRFALKTVESHEDLGQALQTEKYKIEDEIEASFEAQIGAALQEFYDGQQRVNTQVEVDVEERNQLIESMVQERENLFVEGKRILDLRITELVKLMDEYMEAKEANLNFDNTGTALGLDWAEKQIREILDELTKIDDDSDPAFYVAASILKAFEVIGFAVLDQGAKAKLEKNVEVAFMDVNPCMTSGEHFDSGENLFHQTMQKYDKLRMIVADTTSSTEKQVQEVIDLFQDQSVDRDGKQIVPFLCLAKSGTKHDQLGLDISTMGRAYYVMHNSFVKNKAMQKEFRNLKSASRNLSRNTEPALVKKMRRDMRKAGIAAKK